MDNKLTESYLDNIEEFVIDEDKIVTYKLLSRTLGIHVNTAKQLLHTYISKKRNQNSPPISATYLLAGKLKDGSFKVTVVNECDLKETYSSFVEITSEHVYSVQKGKSVKDIKVLSGIGKELQSSKSCVIKCFKSCIKSKNDKKNPAVPCKEEPSKIYSKEKFFGKEDEAKKIEDPVKAESPIKKPLEVLESKKPSPTDKSKGNNNKGQANLKKSKGGIANFFANSTQKSGGSLNNTCKNKNDDAKKKIENPGKAMEGVVEEVVSENKNENKKEIKAEVLKNGQKISPKKSPKKSPIKSPKKSPKKKKKASKRKRIQMLSDSEESDSEKDVSSFEEEVPDSPISVAATLEDDKEEEKPRNKRKKRKIVDKTTLNEDGYLETKKEVIFETDSENDDEEKSVPIKNDFENKKTKQDKVNEKKVSAPNAMKKQASLLNFFKKS